MSEALVPINILMADDDEEDCMLTKKAFEKSRVANRLYFVHDGEELLDYLYLRGKYEDPASAPRPGVILLDLNMPRMDGREALEIIKKDDELRKIPIIILTTSKDEEDIHRTYGLGANSFISKPVDFQSMIEVVETFNKYWLSIVKLPK